MVVPGTPRDSLHILDALLNLDGGVKPEMVAYRQRLLMRGTPADARLGFLKAVSIGQQVKLPTP